MPSKHLITLAVAEEMTKNYRAQKENILDSSYRGKNILPICETFDRDALDEILSQNGCKKVRIYLGMNDTDQVEVILVGVNDQDQDMLPTNNPQIMERSLRCPNNCPPSSALNS